VLIEEDASESPSTPATNLVPLSKKRPLFDFVAEIL